MLQIVKKFYSRRNSVCLIKGNNNTFVRKKFLDEKYFYAELSILQKAGSINVPKLIGHRRLCIDMQYIDGDLLLDKYLVAGVKQMSVLATMLADFLLSFCKVFKGAIPTDVNFRNFIILDRKCFGIDFEEVKQGDINQCIAKIIAFASLYDVGVEGKESFCNTLLQKTGCNYQNVMPMVEQEKGSLIKRRGKL